MLGLLRNRRRIHIHTFCYWARTNKTKNITVQRIIQKQSSSTDSTPQIFIWWLSFDWLRPVLFKPFTDLIASCLFQWDVIWHSGNTLIDTLLKNGNFWFARIIRFFSRRQNWHLCLRFWSLPSFFFSLIENKRVTSLQK